jgi:hypothetical protein
MRWAGAEKLRQAALLVEEAVATLEAGGTACGGCGRRNFDNIYHARLYEQLSELPVKLRRAAARGAATAQGHDHGNGTRPVAAARRD